MTETGLAYQSHFTLTEVLAFMTIRIGKKTDRPTEQSFEVGTAAGDFVCCDIQRARRQNGMTPRVRTNLDTGAGSQLQ